MSQLIAVIYREPQARNDLSRALLSRGHEVTSHAASEGVVSALSRSAPTCLVVADDLEDAAPEMFLRKCADRFPSARLFFMQAKDETLTSVRQWPQGDGTLVKDAVRAAAFIHDTITTPERDASEDVVSFEGPDAGELKICAGSQEMRRVLQMIEVVAPTESTVLLQGESGTGKDLFANYLHQKSRRRGNSLVEVHCGAIPPSLMESELFGHEKGAFTGADQKKEGLCLLADGGTLFLDEIGEMPLDMQVKLLRVLQSGWLRPVGGTRSVQVNLRVIAATNRDLKKEVLAGRFRLDLYYRLNVISVAIPPLRDRTSDIPSLVDAITDRLADRGIPRVRFGSEIMDLLASHPWPGNVRELENIVERLILLFPDGSASPAEVGTMLQDISREEQALSGALEIVGDDGGHEVPVTDASSYPAELTLRELEQLHIRRVLAIHDGNKTRAAAALGINVKTLYNKMKAYNLRKEEFTTS